MHDKAFNIAKNPKYDGYQRDLVSMVFNFFYKRASSVFLCAIHILSKCTRVFPLKEWNGILITNVFYWF